MTISLYTLYINDMSIIFRKSYNQTLDNSYLKFKGDIQLQIQDQVRVQCTKLSVVKILYITIDDSLSNHGKILGTIKRIVKETLRV